MHADTLWIHYKFKIRKHTYTYAIFALQYGKKSLTNNLNM